MDDPFLVSVNAFVEKAAGLAQQAYQATVQDALARVRELTPVQTGFLRASWQAIPARDSGAILGSQPSAILSALSVVTLGDTAVLTNPAPYAMRVEFGFVGEDSLGRYYNQPGRGMLQQTIAEMPQIAEVATARVISGAG